MSMTIGTRIRNSFVWSAGHRLNRAFQNKFYGDVGGHNVENTDISFTNPNTIASASSGFPAYTVNGVIRVQGSASNNRDFVVTAASTSSLTVSGGVTTELAGALVQVSEV